MPFLSKVSNILQNIFCLYDVTGFTQLWHLISVTTKCNTNEVNKNHEASTRELPGVVNKEPARVTVVVHSTPVALNAACMCSIAALAPDSSEHVKMSQMAVLVSGHECTEM